MKTILLAALLATPALADDGQLQRGQSVFLQCRACHSLKPGAPSGLGPNLAGVVGTKAASRAGFAYSPAMKASGLTWDAATLDRYLAAPAKAVPGNRMGFAGIAAPADRAAVIAYLGQGAK